MTRLSKGSNKHKMEGMRGARGQRRGSHQFQLHLSKEFTDPEGTSKVEAGELEFLVGKEDIQSDLCNPVDLQSRRKGGALCI